MPLRPKSAAVPLLAWLCLNVLAACAAAAEPAALDVQRLKAIDAVVAEGIAQGEMPGCVVCIGCRDGIAFLRAFGNRQIEPTAQPMTTDTLFDLASLTKPLATATAVMTLIDAGKLAPDDTVAQHLPEFGSQGKQQITVAQLLTHTAGLTPDNPLGDYAAGPAAAWKHICNRRLISEPGTEFAYSDVGYIVLGKLVERIGGQPLDVYCQQHVFGPLAMSQTGFRPAADARQHAAPTEQRDKVWLKGTVHDPRAAALGGVAGHAGLFSTATDLARYARALLNTPPLTQDPPPLLSAKTRRLMIAPRRVPGGLRTFGWDMQTGYSGNRGEGFSAAAFGHGGFTGTALWIDPERDLFVIFLSNRLHPDGRGSVNGIAGRIGTIAAALDPP